MSAAASSRPWNVVETYEDLVRALRSRRLQLGIPQLDVDHRSGMASGYTAKIEAHLTNPTAKNTRSLGKESLPLLLGALGVELVVVPRGSYRPNPPLSRTERARKAAKARHERTSPEEKSAAGRKAIAARWSRAPATMLPKPLPESSNPTEAT